MSQDIDITQPRECIYQEFEGRAAPCPRCGAPLVQSTQAYLVTTRQGNQIADSFIISNDMGWFCESCPTVVINAQELADMFQHSKPGWNMGNDYAVVGILGYSLQPIRLSK